MDCKMTDIIAIISSIIAIGYSIYSIITKSYIRQYNLEKFEHFSLNQKKVCIVFNFIMTLIIGISGVYILLLYCKIRLTDITQMKRKKNLFGEALILYKNQKKIAKISARNRNVDWLQVKIAEIKKDKKKLERKK